MAGRVTYKPLFQQVDELIQRRGGYPGVSSYEGIGTQLDRESVSPLLGSALVDVSIGEIVRAIVDILGSSIGTVIESGLNVTADNPATGFVNITAGTAVIKGNRYELVEDVRLPIPFDLETEVFYVQLFRMQ